MNKDKNDLSNKLLNNKVKYKSPYDNASILSKLFFFWLNPLLSLGKKKVLEDKDIFKLRDKDKIEKFVKPIEKNFNFRKNQNMKNKKWDKNLILKVIVSNHKKEIFLFGFLGIIKALAGIFSATILTIFIKTFKEEDNLNTLIKCTCGFIALKVIEIFLNAHLNFNLGSLGIKIKFALNYIIYNKLLKIKQFNNNEYSFGDLININNVETNKFIEFFNYMPNIISSPVTLILGIYLLINLMGWSAVIALLTFVVFLFINFKLSKLFIKYEKDLIMKRGKRMKFVNELISGIRFIKFSSLEDFFFENIVNVKEEELQTLRKQFGRTMYTITLSWVVPLSFLTVLILSDYYIYGIIDINKILRAVVLFSVIDETIKFLPNILVYSINSFISGKKINKFLFQEEIDLSIIKKNLNGEDNSMSAIKINDASFYWKKNVKKEDKKKSKKKNKKIENKKIEDKKKVDSLSFNIYKSNKSNKSNNKDQSEFSLNNINLDIKKGSLIGIIGPIGSGKTSLLSSLFGELDLKSKDAKININNSISIVSQKPWIRNKTLKDNILNGKYYNEDLYKQCIKYSCLEDDLKLLDDGDETLIGDKGINLSGGQKVRVSIARALYSEKEIILMDDPLSALDMNVSNFIFKNSILELLKDKTRVIITHNLNFLDNFDRILLLEKGCIVEDGTYEEINKTENFKNLIDKINENENKKRKESNDKETGEVWNLKKIKSTKKKDLNIVNEENKDNNDPMITRLMNTENRSVGKVSFGTIIDYLKFSESKIRYFLVIIILILLGVSYSYSYYFIKYADKFENKNLFLFYYTSINLFQAVLVYFRLLIVFDLSIKISRKLNKMMIFKLLHCSLLKFLDKIPIGTILNRFSNDIEQIDRYLVMVFSFLVFLIQRIVVSITICCIFATPYILIFFILFLFVANLYRKYYMKTFREINRLMRISSSPVNQIITETILGNFVIRVFNIENQLTNEHNSAINNNLKYKIIYNGLRSWFILRITILNLIIIIPCFIFVIIFNKDSKDKESIGIMFNFLLIFINLSTYFMNVLSFFEEKMISFERCRFITKIEPEKNYKINVDTFKTNLNKNKPIDIKEGKITLENLKLRYSKNLPYVIKGINCELHKKIGIIGRTGAGKSTLIQSFYGLFDNYEGKIKIDNIDISSIDLQNLRSCFSIISQDPILFEDTIRKNLDPLNIKSDEFIYQLIDELELSNKIIDLGGLQGKIESQGKNLSNGEKQLFCLIRIIINKKKIILLDEATSNIDSKTEEIIQKTMDKYFQDSTQIIIAHRLNTILNCDKILVLEEGIIKEFDSPTNLLNDEDSYFGNLYKKNYKLAEYLK